MASCFGWAQLHAAPWFLLWRYVRLNWSCRVLVGSPHKTSQRGFLPHLQPKGSAQIDTSYPGVPWKKCKWTNQLGSDASMDP